MNKITKIFVAILSSVVISTSAFAGELAVTGSEMLLTLSAAVQLMITIRVLVSLTN